MGDTLRRLRQAAGLTQQDVANAAGVGGSAVSQWEGGQTLPSARSLLVVARLFDLSDAETLALMRERFDVP